MFLIFLFQQTIVDGASASQDNKESDQLHSAALLGDVTKIESLLSLGFPVDSRDATNKTPLMIAAANGKLQAVKCLLGKGASPSLENNDGWNSLHFASQSGNTDIIELLLLTHGPDIDSTTAEGLTPLMIAVDNGKHQAVTLLIEKGASPSLESNNGWNSLHFASESGNTDMIELLLLTHGLDIDSTTADGWTPLMKAAGHGKHQAVTLLIEKGASPSLENNNGCNSLHFASLSGNTDIIELLLLTHGPDIDSTTADGFTPLMIAAGHGKLQAVTLLIEKGASPSLADKYGWNSLHFASKSGNTDIIELLLLTHGPDIDSTTADGSTPLMIAALCGKLQVVTFLIGKGSSPSLESNSGWNSLHWASRNGNTVIIDTLLSHGVDIESKSKSGETPLMIARRHRRTEAVNYLLSKGAKSDKRKKQKSSS